ncbi:unnamed protein product [Linum trigynum]|uniref:Uncharacterized protein n=1 Tax=Linum trigynum TaxID=586398 RepID=A0AAV2FX47_9ROSI
MIEATTIPPSSPRSPPFAPVAPTRSEKIEPLFQLFDNESTATLPWKARSRTGSNGGRAVEREPGSEREGEVAERWRRRGRWRWTGRRVGEEVERREAVGQGEGWLDRSIC